MKASIKVLSVREVKGFINENSVYAGDANEYNSSMIISRKYDPKALFIECVLDGKKVSFYSPTVIVTVRSGMLNFKTMPENKWFELITGESISHKGNPIFDGGERPNCASETKCEILPRVKSGDILNISYSASGSKINRVKVL